MTHFACPNPAKKPSILRRRVGRELAIGSFALAAPVLFTRVAQAQPTGTPPPDAKPLVAGPAPAAAAPTKVDPLDVTTASVSAGGQVSTGNTRQIGGTGSGQYETRFSNNGLGFSLLGNYAEGGPPGQPREVQAENIQGRVRYDRYLIDSLSLFLINTGRHDRFQGLNFRYNLDPGVKYLVVQEPATKQWFELGYDLQYDVRERDALKDADGNRIPNLKRRETNHSTRVFAGVSHAFNDAVNLNAGLEYLQSVLHSYEYRVNFSTLFAAKIGAGLAIGAGFNLLYDRHPLPGIEKVDTQTILSVIYSFSDAPPTSPPPPPPPCTPVPAPNCPVAAPPPAPTPEPAPAVTDPPSPAPDTMAPAPDTMAPAPVTPTP